MNNKIFFIDPQTLSMYDYELLSRMEYSNVYFFGSQAYNYLPLTNIKLKLWFRYGFYKKQISKGISYVLTMLRILLYILLNRPQIIHIQWIRIPSFDYFYYLFLRKCFNIKLVYTVHNLLPHKIKKGDKKKYKRMYELCDALIVHTITTKNDLSNDFKIKSDKIYVAPHGPLSFNKNEDDIKEEITSIENQYNLKNKNVFSILGTQSEYKGTDLLVEAWTKSKKLRENDNIALVIAGNNSSQFLKSSKYDNIKLIDGLLSDLTFKALIRRSNVMVLPYRRIEQSGVLLSLIMDKIPYCATEVGELTIPIKQENIGWIIPEMSADSVRLILERIVEHPEEIKEKSENINGWQKVAALYDWDHSAQVTENVYSILLLQ